MQDAALYTCIESDSPLLIDVPHAGTWVPQSIRAMLTPVAQTLPDTDWHIPLLYEFAIERGATLLAATHSRYVIDLNRDPNNQALYPGADNTELCPTRSFMQDAIYCEGRHPSAAEVEQRRERYWSPYHAMLAEQIERIRQRHGYVILLDAHSIYPVLPRFFEGRLPQLNLGTASGQSCAPAVQGIAADVLAAASAFTSVVNGRFKGGYVTRHYGKPGQGVHALQLEIAQDAYMQADAPYAWNPRIAQRLQQQVLKPLIDGLLSWVPPL